MLARTLSRKGRGILLAPVLLALTTVTASAAGQHLTLSAKSARAGTHLRITVTGYAAHSVKPIFLACKSQRDPIFGSWIWEGKTDANGTLSIQKVVPTPANPFKRPYTSCRVYATDSKGTFSISVPFRILSPKK